MPYFALPLSLLGTGVSSYHVLLQNGLFGEAGTCAIGVPCSIRYVNYLGFITIPLLCLTAFILISILMLMLLGGEPADQGAEPTLSSWQLGGAGLLVIVLLALWGWLSMAGRLQMGWPWTVIGR